MRLMLVAISLMLGHHVVTATHAPGSDVDSSDHALMVEECTGSDSSAPNAGPVPNPPSMVMTGVGTVTHFEPDVLIMLASEAPTPDASLLRLYYQVFLN